VSRYPTAYREKLWRIFEALIIGDRELERAVIRERAGIVVSRDAQRAVTPQPR
jgi:hypothetical protein